MFDVHSLCAVQNLQRRVAKKTAGSPHKYQGLVTNWFIFMYFLLWECVKWFNNTVIKKWFHWEKGVQLDSRVCDLLSE